MEKISDRLTKFQVYKKQSSKDEKMKKINYVLTGVYNEDLKLLKDNPEEFWKGVTEIGKEAFRGCTALESITIPDSVTKINMQAFSGCTALESIIIPDSVTYIGAAAFEECISLKSIKIPDSVTDIKDGAFMGCKALETIDIPSSVTKILPYTFSACKSLQSITIPDSVTVIRAKAFIGCEALKSIKIPSVESFDLESGLFFGCKELKEVTLPECLKTEDETKLQKIRDFFELEKNVAINFGGKDDNQKAPTDHPHTPTPRDKV